MDYSNFKNLVEAYHAVYDDEIRNEFLVVEDEDLSFIDDLSDNELVQVMEEIFIEGEFAITECVELLDSELLSEESEMERMNRLQNKATRERKSAAATAKRMKSAERERVGRKHAVKRLQVAATRAGRNVADRAKTLGAGAASAVMGGASEAGRKLSSAKNKVKRFLGNVKRAAQSGYSAAKKEFSGQAGKEAKARTTGRQMKRAARKQSREKSGKDTSEFEKPKSASGPYRNVGAGTKEKAGGSTEKPTSTSYNLSSERRKKAQEKLKRAATGRTGGVRFSAGPAGQTSNTAMKSGADATVERQKKAKQFAKKAGISDSYEYLLDSIFEDMINEGYVSNYDSAYVVLESLSETDLDYVLESYDLYLNEDTVDIYDIVLEHLVVEGYADTLEQAEAIMVNMSEDWREEIIDEAYVDYRKGKLPSGRTPQQAAQGRTKLLNARAKVGENDPYGSKWQRRFNQSNRTKEMDSHTGLRAKVGKQLWARDMGNEPNTERHYDARKKRKNVSDLKSAEKESRG